jgi:hypothetical protein
VTDAREPKDSRIGQTTSRAFEREERWRPSSDGVSEGARHSFYANRSVSSVNHHLQRLEVASTKPSRDGNSRRAHRQTQVQTFKPARRPVDRFELVVGPTEGRDSQQPPCRRSLLHLSAPWSSCHGPTWCTHMPPVGRAGLPVWASGKWSRRSEAHCQRGLPLLLGRADQHLIHRDVPRPGNDVGDRVGDVLGLHRLPELVSYAVEHFGPVVAG